MNINGLERKFGKYSIPNLSLVLIGAYVLGYIMQFAAPEAFQYMYLDPYMILHGQVWRLISWIMIPPYSLGLFTLINLYFFFSLGRVLENLWGDFRYNLYILSGILFVIVGSFLIYGFAALTGLLGFAQLGPQMFSFGMSQYVSTYYINICVIMAFAMTVPDMQILFWFIIPLKIKWLAYLEGVILLLEFISCPFPAGKCIIAFSVLNFLFFFLTSRNGAVKSVAASKRRKAYERKMSTARPKGITRHKCAVCGRTEEDDPSLVFRFCTVCNGNYEYCQDHLFTHEHIH